MLIDFRFIETETKHAKINSIYVGFQVLKNEDASSSESRERLATKKVIKSRKGFEAAYAEFITVLYQKHSGFEKLCFNSTSTSSV